MIQKGHMERRKRVKDRFTLRYLRSATPCSTPSVSDCEGRPSGQPTCFASSGSTARGGGSISPEQSWPRQLSHRHLSKIRNTSVSSHAIVRAELSDDAYRALIEDVLEDIDVGILIRD